MATQLSEAVELRIASQIASGRFDSGDAVVDQALSALDWLEERRASDLAQLEERLARGIAQLERGEGIDGRTFEARMAARFPAFSSVDA